MLILTTVSLLTQVFYCYIDALCLFQVEHAPGSGIWLSATEKQIIITEGGNSPRKLIRSTLKTIYRGDSLSKMSACGLGTAGQGVPAAVKEGIFGNDLFIVIYSL